MLIDNFRYLCINNRSSLKYFPFNEASKFTIKTPETLNFDPAFNWYIGVSNFSHGNIRRSRKIIKFIKTGENISLRKVLSHFKIYDQVKKEKYFFSKTKDIRNEFDDENVEIIEQLTFFENDLKVSIPYKVQYDLSEFLCSLLKQMSAHIDVSLYIRGLSSYVNEIDDILTVDTEHVNYICIHLDFITNQIIGDKLLKIAFISPVISDSEICNHNITNIIYNKIEKSNIQEIHCYISDEHGEKIKFKNDEMMTNIILSIKKV